MAAFPSRKLLTIALVILTTLLTITLYRLTSLETCFKMHRAVHGDLSALWRNPEGTAERPHAAACEIEQVKAGYSLYQMLIKEPLHFKCQKPRTIQNRDEGSWTYCADPGFALKKPCLVYSFGINYDFTFDDAAGKLGCQVLSFDPSMRNLTDRRRNENVMFYLIGLGSHDTDTFEPRLNSYVAEPTKWKMRTLKTLLQQMKHADRTIDLLKIDIESSEWQVIRNILDTGVLRQVKQLLLEWHIFPDTPPRKEYVKLAEVLDELKAAGFRSFHRHEHPVNLDWSEFNVQSDVAYVNVKFKDR
ncbi:probable methyltransferase-like protein 24 [Littorina saxatilis]|uniref:probable methyltransferase-like protein 24 n=1 Tax=Littorina saxatilis TaxID=31220 RepID=UPI0038B600E0